MCEKQEKTSIQISNGALDILRRLFLSVEEKQRELDDVKEKLNIAITMSLALNEIKEHEYSEWKTDLDEGVHKKIIKI